MSLAEETAALKAQGLTTKQIAERFGVGLPCIRKRLSRAAMKDGSAPKPWPKCPARRAVIKDGPLPPVVNREPCPFCQVRADIGCRHQGRATIEYLPRLELAL